MYRDVLVATDGSAAATAAVRLAVQIAESHHARLTVVAAVRPPGPWAVGGLALLVAVPAGPCTPVALLADAERAAEGWLAAACEHVPDDLPLTKVLLHGAPLKAILARLADGGHDLVVLGRDGAVAQHLARRTDVPVLVGGTPPFAFAPAAIDDAADAVPQSTSVVP